MRKFFEKTQQDFLGKVSFWDGSVFEKIAKTNNDARGELGEIWFSEWIKNLTTLTINTDRTNSSVKADGHYDMKINNARVEIKTAVRGASKTWQHEPLYTNEFCDYVVFIDVDFDKVFLTIVHTNELPLVERSVIFPNRMATLRKNKDNGYKLDFSNKTISDLQKAGRCFTITFETAPTEIGSFIEQFLLQEAK